MISQMKYSVCILLLLLAGAGSATERHSFVVGVEDSQYFPHYAFRDGKWLGFGAELLNAFSESRGYQFEYRAMPIERLYRSFLAGELDFKYPDNPEWRKDLKQTTDVFYSDPVVGFIDGVSVLPENLGQGVDKIALLGTIRGFTPVSWLEFVNSGQVKVVENDSFKGLINQALIGRIDGVYANIDVVQHRLSEVTGTSTALTFDENLPYLKAHYRLSTIQNNLIIAEFNKWLRDNEAIVGRLKSKYFEATQ